MTDANLYICLNCKHKMRRSSFYAGAVNEPCDVCGQLHIERYDALQEFVRAEAAKARQVGQYQAADAIYGDVTTLFMLKDRLPKSVHRTVDDLLNKTEAHMNVNRNEYKSYLAALSSNQKEETDNEQRSYQT